MQQINGRIKQKYDILSNWSQHNIVLLNGELAVVGCGNQIKFKVGNGLSTFNQLPFIDQEVLSTKWMTANAVSQGTHAKAVPFGLATGAYLCANANFSQALGFDAQTLSSDNYSFVWNGDDTRAIGDYYESHGKGTFSINALSGLSGIFIGEQSLAEVLDTKGGNKITIDDRISEICQQSNLSVVKLSANEYHQLVASGQALSNCLYVVENQFSNMYGQQIKNLAQATDFSDAVTLEQTSGMIDVSLSAKADKSQLSNYLPLSGGQLSGDLSVIDAGYVQAPSTSISAVKVNSTNNYFIVADEAFSYNDDGTADSCGDPAVGAIGFAVLNAKVSGDDVLLKLSGDNVASIVDDFVESLQDANTLWSLALYGYHESNSISVISACTGNYNGWICCKKNSTLEEIALSCESGVWAESDLVNMFLSVNNGFYVPKHPYVGNQKITNFHTQFATGGSVKAIGKYAHAEGRANIADGRFSHVEGNNNFAGGTGSHVEGQDNYASASTTHAEGNATSALAFAAHTEGGRTLVTGSYSHAEGFRTQVTKECSHAEGCETSAFGNHSHVEGTMTKAAARNAHAEGYGSVASGQDSHAQGLSTLASGNQSFAGGSQTSATNLYSFAYGISALASNENATVFGKSTKASGKYSFALGNGSEATASYAFAGGNKSKAKGDNSFAYGNAVSALAANAYAIGNATNASAYNAVAIGDNCSALGQRSIALGRKSKAINDSQFVWNGTSTNYWPNTPGGTFNVNPELGLNGFYIGNKNLCSIIDNAILNVQIPTDLSAFTNSPGYLTEHQSLSNYYQKSETSSASEISTALTSINVGNKVFIDDRISGIVEQTDLSIVHLSSSEYEQLCANGQILSNALYIVEDSFTNNYNKQIKNVAEPTLSTDAATKGYVDDAISSIEIPTDLSAFTNSPGYLSAHQSLSNYYQKSDTSSASEISNALSPIEQQLSGLEEALQIINYGDVYENLTRLTMQNGEVKLHNVSGTLNDQWFIDNGYLTSYSTWLSDIIDVHIGNNVSSISYSTFYNNYKIASITVPSCVTNIANTAFKDARRLSSITFTGRTISQVQSMTNYSFGIGVVWQNPVDESTPITINCSDGSFTIQWSIECFPKGTKILMADGTQKNIEDITYNDSLKVWDFDNGCLSTAQVCWLTQPGLKNNHYYQLTFSDGTILKTTGQNSNHKIYDVDKCKFEGVRDVQVGDRIYSINGIVTVTDKQYVEDVVEYYNLMTAGKINCFAEGILASNRYSNIYAIDSNMVYVKNGRQVRPYAEFEAVGISRYFYDNLRLGEIDSEKEALSSTVKYIKKISALMLPLQDQQ